MYKENLPSHQFENVSPKSLCNVAPLICHNLFLVRVKLEWFHLHISLIMAGEFSSQTHLYTTKINNL